jgi:uncharacterized protein (TIGR02265 family)
MRPNDNDNGHYEIPPWNAPYDIDREIAAAPADGTIRGMFFSSVIERAKKERGVVLDGQSYTAFGKYPLRDYLLLLARSAAVLYPGVPVREGLRRLGSSVYNEFLETMVGRAIFSIAGKSFARVVAISPRAYDACYDPVHVETRVEGNIAHVTMAPMWVFPDTFHVGVWEGAAKLYGTTADVRIKKIRPGFVSYEVRF